VWFISVVTGHAEYSLGISHYPVYLIYLLCLGNWGIWLSRHSPRPEVIKLKEEVRQPGDGRVATRPRYACRRQVRPTFPW
jgi:hypothetical protein